MDIFYLMGFRAGHEPSLGAMGSLCLEEDLHLTVLGPFSLAHGTQEAFQGALCHEVKQHEALTLYGSEDQWFGDEGKIPVKLLAGAGAERAQKLHSCFLQLLQSHGGKLLQPEFAGSNYRPHISYWHGRGSFLVKSLSLVLHRGGFGEEVINLANYSFGG